MITSFQTFSTQTTIDVFWHHDARCKVKNYETIEALLQLKVTRRKVCTHRFLSGFLLWCKSEITKESKSRKRLKPFEKFIELDRPENFRHNESQSQLNLECLTATILSFHQVLWEAKRIESEKVKAIWKKKIGLENND